MIRILLALYKRFPLRPHCSPAGHVLLCRLIEPHLPAVTCGERPSNYPSWKKWPIE